MTLPSIDGDNCMLVYVKMNYLYNLYADTKLCFLKYYFLSSESSATLAWLSTFLEKNASKKIEIKTKSATYPLKFYDGPITFQRFNHFCFKSFYL